MSNVQTTTSASPANGRVLPNLADMEREIATLKAELANRRNGKLSFKVTEKGCVGIVGLRRFPVALYAQEIERIVAALPALQTFIAENASTLSRK